MSNRTGVLLFTSCCAAMVGFGIGFPYYMNHQRDSERASDSCYSLFESYYETYPDFRIFILKSKADGVFTRGECNDLMDMNAKRREAELQKEQDEKLKSIGETLPEASNEITPVDLKQ